MNKTYLGIVRVTIGAVVIIGFFVSLYLLLGANEDLPPNVRIVLEIMLGALIGAFTTIVGFYFGSSQGSEDKTEHIVSGNGEG
jgi:hypothetical protein